MTNKSPSPTTDATPLEKLQTLLQDQALRNAQRRRDASTFSQFATSEANADTGRYAQINKAAVVGATPKQPDYAAPNWANDPTGVEPPLGFDVNEIEPVGRQDEIEASIQRLELERAATQGLPSHDGRSVEAAGSASDSVEPPPNQFPQQAGLGDPTPLGAVQRRKPK